jgi:hypothetical protein
MSLASAVRDIRRFVTSGGFEVSMTLTSPVSFTPHGEEPTYQQIAEWPDSVIVKGIESTINAEVSTDGLPINSRNTRITIIEADLKDMNYPVRNSRNEIALTGHLVDYVDKFGVQKHMKIKDTMPAESVGTITCFLNEYGS